MSLSLNANFLFAFRQHRVEPRWLVRIWYASAASVEVTNGVMDGAAERAWQIVVSDITQLQRSLDVFTRKITADSVDVNLTNDAFVRNLVQTYGLAGTRVEVLIGERSLAEADFESYFVGILDDIVWSPEGITLQLKTCVSKLRDAKYTGSFVNMHPLECISELLDAAGINSDLIDSTSLAYDVDTTRSHWVVDRSDNDLHLDRAIKTPTQIDKLIDELSAMVQGTLFVDEDGKFTFQYLDLTRSTVADWTNDDVFDVNVRSLYCHRANQIIATSHAVPFAGGDDGEDFTYQYRREDINAQNAFPYCWSGGSSSKRHTRMQRMEWVSGSCAKVPGAFGNPGVGTTVKLTLASGAGYAICGTRWPSFPGVAQPANSKVSATRLLYMLIEDEVISFDQLTFDTTRTHRFLTIDDGESGSPWTNLAAWLDNSYVMPIECTARVAARDVFGTATTTNHSTLRPGTRVHHLFDVTIATDVASTQLRRFGNGAPVVELRTSLEQYAVQLGDFVTLTLDEEQLSWKGHAGSDTSVKWEVTGKTVELDSDTPSILWTLVYATETSPPAESLSHIPWRAEPRVFSFRAGNSMRNNDVFSKGVVSGFELSYSAVSFAVTLGKGIASAGESRSELPDSFGLTMTASKDTYLYWDCSRGSIIVREQSLGGAYPTDVGENEILLWIVTTDGSGVASVFDNRGHTFIQPYTMSASTYAGTPDAASVNTTFMGWREGSP